MDPNMLIYSRHALKVVAIAHDDWPPEACVFEAIEGEGTPEWLPPIHPFIGTDLWF